MDAPSHLGSPGAAPSPPPPDGRPGPRRLTRRPDDGHIAGVCAGVAEYFNVDPVIVRIAAVVLLFSGPGLIAYILVWIFVDAEPGLARYGEAQAPIDRKDRGTQIFGIVLLGLGVSVIWGDWWSPARGWLFPLGLMALGGWLLLRPDRDDEERLPPIPPTPPVPPASAWAWSSPSAGAAGEDATVTDPLVDVTTDLDPTTSQPTTEASFGGAGSSYPPRAPWDVPPSPVPGPLPMARHEHHHRHRHRHMVGPGVFGVLLVWAGIAWLTGVGLTTGLAVGLVILGLGFVLGSFVGGSRALILPALLVAAALAVSATIDIPLTGPVGEQQWAPQSRSELEDLYDVSMGEGTLDLTGLGLVQSETTVRATVGLGHLVVYVAEDQDLFVNTDIGAGEALVFGERDNGVGVESHQAYPGRGATLVLDLEVGMGQIEVRRAEDTSTTSSTTTTSVLG